MTSILIVLYSTMFALFSLFLFWYELSWLAYYFWVFLSYYEYPITMFSTYIVPLRSPVFVIYNLMRVAVIILIIRKFFIRAWN